MRVVASQFPQGSGQWGGPTPRAALGSPFDVMGAGAPELLRAHVPMIEKHRPIKAWIIDNTGFPKQGVHSVGMTRQYCGQLGKQDNCQVAVSLSVANDHESLPIAFRLYLPEDWAKDSARRPHQPLAKKTAARHSQVKITLCQSETSEQ